LSGAFRRFLALVLLCLAALPLHAGAKSDLERFGDIGQIVLPVIAGICAVRQQRFGDFAAGFGTTQVVVHGLKRTLGDARLNHRPNGTLQGFPSGHTAAAVFGATSIARHCVPDRPILGGLAYGTAAAVGISRIAADKHDPFQVGVGALIGYYANGITFTAGPRGFAIGFSLNF
jgi:membrane-associated phospholipid phosphatase